MLSSGNCTASSLYSRTPFTWLDAVNIMLEANFQCVAIIFNREYFFLLMIIVYMFF